MANKFQQLAGMLGDQQAKKLGDQEGSINNLANSKDGQKVKAIIEQDAANLQNAVKTGDVATLKNTLNTLMGTEEGARFIKQINDMMK